MHLKTFKRLPYALLLTLLPIGCGRPGDKGKIRPPLPVAQRAIAADGKTIHAPTTQVYSDSELTLTAPRSWDVKLLPSADANLHQLELSHPSGFFGRLTFIRSSDAAGTFPSDILKHLKQGNDTLTSKAINSKLGGQGAKGFAYSYQLDERTWSGRVISFTQGNAELCFLGQYPAKHEATIAVELDRVVQSIRLQSKASKKGQTVSVQP